MLYPLTGPFGGTAAEHSALCGRTVLRGVDITGKADEWHSFGKSDWQLLLR